MKVYHPTTGQVYEGEPIDCRELMQIGGYLKQPPEPKAAEVAPATPAPTTPPPQEPALPADLNTLTKTQLQEVLTARGVPFESDANKGRLIELVEQGTK